MAKPEHHARWQATTKRRHRRTCRQKEPSAPRWRSRTAPNTRRFDVKVDGSASARMYNPNARLRLRSQIGEMRGSLYRISVAEYMAREAAVGGGAGAEPSSSPTPSKVAATHDTNPLFGFTRDDSAAVHGGAGKGSSSWSPKTHPHGTKRLLLAAAAEPRPEFSATPPASKRSKTTIQGTEPPVTTNAAGLTLKALQVVPERHNAEPDVLVRASYLKTRFAGLIAKAAETLSIRHRQDLEKRPAADEEKNDEGEMALLREEERNAQVGALRKMAREALQEVERNARLTGLGMVETIHPVHLMELGITAIEHFVSPERSRDGTHKYYRRRGPLEKLGLFVKPADDCCEEEMETI